MLYCPSFERRARSTLPGRARREPSVTEDLIDLARLRRLEPEAITAVHMRFYSQLFRYAAYRTGDQQVAEDIAADVFLRLLEALKKGRGPTTSISGWLHRTAAHAISDHFRQALRQPTERLAEQTVSAEAGPLQSAEASEQAEAVREAMAKLTEAQQHVLALRFGSGLSLQDTATALGKEPNAVKALQFRALQSLKRSMGDARS